ncbi:unnamed protein product [Diamesa serratosioi]
MNLLIEFVIFLGVSQLSRGEDINCVFINQTWSLKSFYTCDVTSLENSNNSMVITGYKGNHKPKKSDLDVKGLWVQATNTKFIPGGLGLLFNLTSFVMEHTNLVELKSKDFHGMENVEYSGFWNNKLTHLPTDVFSKLIKLKRISLSYNQIEEITEGVFSSNVNLERIQLYGNKIKYIGAGLLSELTKLNFVDLDNNICISKLFTGATELIQLRREIKVKCRSPNEIPKITQDLNEMHEDIIKLENELLNVKNEQQMERLELNEVKMELLDAKEEHRIERIEFEEKMQEINDKLLSNIVLVLLVFGGVSRLSHGVELNCNFKDQPSGSFGLFYACEVTSLNNINNDEIVTGITGKHMVNRKDNDIKGIMIVNTNSYFIPTNLGSHCNLISFAMFKTKLIVIKSKDFQAMENLEYLDLGNNNLTFIPIDAFTTLIKLKIVSLSFNEIEELPIDVFAKNVNLERILLTRNKIKFLGPGVFNELAKLNVVSLVGNSCVDRRFDGITQIVQLNADIEMSCKSPTSLKLVDMEHTITHLAKENKKLNIDLVKANGDQQKNQNELEKTQKELVQIKLDLSVAKDELNQVIKELLKAKDELKTQQDDNDNLKTEISIAVDNNLKERMKCIGLQRQYGSIVNELGFQDVYGKGPKSVTDESQDGDVSEYPESVTDESQDGDVSEYPESVTDESEDGDVSEYSEPVGLVFQEEDVSEYPDVSVLPEVGVLELQEVVLGVVVVITKSAVA